MQAELFDEQLGVLVLGCDPYVVTSLLVGSPAVRDNTRDRALGDGSIDDTRYLGARAITATLRLKAGKLGCGSADMQALIDAVTPYMSPKRRPTLTWQLPNSAAVRSAVVRGDGWPYSIASPKHPGLGLSFKVPSGEILAGQEGSASSVVCEEIRPAVDVEAGRVYDLVFDRTYPASSPVGSRTITNEGTADTHWRLTIFGPVTDPSFTINGHVVSFNRGGGLVLFSGQNVVIDTRTSTALFNGNPIDSRYDRLNYDAWSWHQLLLQPNNNVVRFDGTGMSAATSAVLCFTPTYI